MQSKNFSIKHAMMHIHVVSKIIENNELNMEDFQKKLNDCNVILKDIQKRNLSANDQVL